MLLRVMTCALILVGPVTQASRPGQSPPPPQPRPTQSEPNSPDPRLARSTAPRQATDTVLMATAGSRLDFRGTGGTILIRTWDRDSVRVQSDASAGSLSIQSGATSIVINPGGNANGGMPPTFQVTVPAGMPVQVSGTSADISVEGTCSDISAETFRGNIHVRGGNGRVALRTVNGTVTLDGARGRIAVRSVEQNVRLTGLAGSVTAETISGDIVMERMDADSVSAATMSGHVSFEGTIREGGYYSLTTHAGNATMVVPDNLDAQVTVTGAGARFQTSFPVRLADTRGNRRHSFVLGNGGATIELESMNGNTILRHRNALAP
jgi:DUF4097 and DUF4098 domain-containing protein YvlB